MPIYSFRVFEVDFDYYGGEDGTVLDETTLEIFDTDDSLNQQPSADPDNDQTFSINGGPFTSNYIVDFQDFSVVNGGGPEFELFAFVLDSFGPNEAYYVFSKDPGFNPSVGDDLTVSSYNDFTITDYGEIESSICFARGTYIRTPTGERRIEDLHAGDLVETADRGAQAVDWISYRKVKRAELERHPSQRPVILKAGSCGNTHDLIVSQQHAVHTSEIAPLARNFPDHLLRAKHVMSVLGGKARIARGCRQIDYHHLLLPNHELIWANGALCESLRLAPQSLATLSRSTISQIQKIRPSLSRRLSREQADTYMPPVRLVLKRRDLREQANFLERTG